LTQQHTRAIRASRAAPIEIPTSTLELSPRGLRLNAFPGKGSADGSGVNCTDSKVADSSEVGAGDGDSWMGAAEEETTKRAATRRSTEKRFIVLMLR